MMNRAKFISRMGGIGIIAMTPILNLIAREKLKSNKIGQSTGKVVLAGEGKKLHVLGNNQIHKLTGFDTDGRFTLIEENNPPGAAIPLHVHEHEDEVFKVISGEVEFTLGANTSVLKDGDVIFLPRRVPHAFANVGPTNARLMLSIFPAGLESMFEELSQLPPGEPDLDKVGAICGEYGVKFV